MDIVCFGAANMDRKAYAHGMVRAGTSNVVDVETDYGGVARNVAAVSALLGDKASLVARVGNDAEADSVLSDLAVRGVATEHVSRSVTRRTGSYTALVGSDGEMFVAFADMRIHEEMRPSMLETPGRRLPEAPHWFLDSNLSTETLERIATRKPEGTRLAADTVSLDKAERLRPILPSLDLLFANRAEADALGGADELVKAGVGAVVVTDGARGAHIVDADGAEHVAALARHLVDATGAGDALAAGTLHALRQGATALDSVRFGQACAARISAHRGTIPREMAIAGDVA